MSLLTDTVIKGAADLGLVPGTHALAAFDEYYAFLTEKNAVMNLTAISGEEETAKKHFLDCMAILKYAQLAGKKVIDIGSGAGFPGMPLKIMCPAMKLTMADALQKRVDFLSELCQKTQVSAECVHARAEELALDRAYRERYDFAVSRAVANLSMLAELCLPFVKVGGAMLAMKGTDSEEEINGAKSAIKTLGGVIEKVEDYRVPLCDFDHRIIIIRKKEPTGRDYPRRFDKIKKKPL